MARSTDGKGKLGRLFDDLSMAQVVAGALAAVTSMLLASRIGIAGSVIGVAVGSVVSAVASQLYKKFLTASAEKLRELKPGETGYVPPQGAETPAATAGGRATADAAETVRLGAVPEPVVPLGSATRRTRTPRADDAALRGDPSVAKARERRDRKKKVQRGVVIVSVVSAVAAVALSAVVIDLATTGQGVGAKTPPLVVPQEQKAGGDAEGAPDASKDAASTAPNDSAGDASKGSSSSGDASSNAGSDQGSSGSSGSSGSTGSSGGSQDGSGSTEGGQSGSGSQDPASKPGSDGSSSGSGQSGSNQPGSGSGSTGGSSSGSTGGSASSASSGKAAVQAGTALPVARA
ncbi:hypothetical protein C1878_03360 [Gordonibacter sp. 28C]|uniref:hypothetical protein n=1 Tax=Gordonibacter sp. 28C TaxID=2078569 RepID=UPI000DF85ADB|nr:hypothetical protein [Gordonibacter sp. 28C]RDB63848.1 hypothetical protein C1878_03360 [Gordonibacter sp. 28C]